MDFRPAFAFRSSQQALNIARNLLAIAVYKVPGILYERHIHRNARKLAEVFGIDCLGEVMRGGTLPSAA